MSPREHQLHHGVADAGHPFGVAHLWCVGEQFLICRGAKQHDSGGDGERHGSRRPFRTVEPSLSLQVEQTEGDEPRTGNEEDDVDEDALRDAHRAETVDKLYEELRAD